MKAKPQLTALARHILFAGVSYFLAGCSETRMYETAICALVDVSGTYADEKANVTRLIKAGILPEMVSGDSLFFITIDSNSFSEENLKHKVTLDYRPSHANRQKLNFANALDEFAASGTRSSYTDISGAMMLCSDYLKNTGTSTQLVFIFSDMQEDLQQGVSRTFEENEFAGIHFAAMNVIKLAKDSSDPQIYRNRLREWERRVADAGAAQWQVIFESSHIPQFIAKAK